MGSDNDSSGISPCGVKLMVTTLLLAPSYKTEFLTRVRVPTLNHQHCGDKNNLKVMCLSPAISWLSLKGGRGRRRGGSALGKFNSMGSEHMNLSNNMRGRCL